MAIDIKSLITLFGYSIGLTLTILFIVETSRTNFFKLSDKIKQRTIALFTKFIEIFILCLLLLSTIIQIFRHFSLPISNNDTWYLQFISAWLIFSLTFFIICKFLGRRNPLMPILLYSVSILIALIGGRFLFIRFAFLTEHVSSQITLWNNPHFRFIFFITSHFFISVALLHLLTKTRFLKFLPDKLLPASALFVTSIDTTYSIFLLL